jgi:tetratricopeptide (TPR) repeat protein
MTAAADALFDEALQAASAVHRAEGQITLPAQEKMELSGLLQALAVQRAEAGDMARARQIARSIPYDARTKTWTLLRAQTLLTLADLQMHAGSVTEEALDDALAAERDARFGRVTWRENSADARLLCNIAKAQVRAGQTAKAAVTFDEALRLAQAPTGMMGFDDGRLMAPVLADVADAQREAGLTAAARETLDRAATLAEAVTDGDRVLVLARLAEARAKAGDDIAPDIFARALSIARALPDVQRDPRRYHLRVYALKDVAVAQARAGLRNDAASTFAEAAGVVAQDWPVLSSIGVAQQKAGFITEAAATFVQALVAPPSINGEKTNLIHEINRRDGQALVAASPALLPLLIDVAETATTPMSRAYYLSLIARAMPD